MERAVSDRARDPALPEPRRRPLRPAPRHPAEHSRRRGALRRASAALADRDRGRGAILGEVLRDGVRMPVVGRTAPHFDGLDEFEGDWYHTARWPAGRGRARRQARRRDRDRLDRDPADPAARQAGGAPVRLPAHRELQHAGAQRAARPGAAAGGQGRLSGAAAAGARVAQRRPALAPRCRPAALGARSRAPGARSHLRARDGPRAGSAGCCSRSTTSTSNAEANGTAAEFVRSKIRQIVQDPATAEALCPTDASDRHQADLRRHRLLRDLQPRQRDARRCPQRPDRRAITRRGIRTDIR